MLKIDELPYWLQFDFVFQGAEEGDGEGEGGEGSEGDGDGDGDGEGGDGSDGEEGGEGGGDDTEALRKALRAERLLRKKTEREKKALERKQTQDANKDKPEIERLTTERDTAANRVQVLAERFQRTAVDRAIEKAAARLNFADVEDAVQLVDRNEIDVDQDDDEPENVTVDEKSVERVVKALADKKKHLLKTATDGDGRETGGKHGGGQRGNGKQTEVERKAELRGRYKHL